MLRTFRLSGLHRERFSHVKLYSNCRVVFKYEIKRARFYVQIFMPSINVHPPSSRMDTLSPRNAGFTSVQRKGCTRMLLFMRRVLKLIDFSKGHVGIVEAVGAELFQLLKPALMGHGR